MRIRAVYLAAFAFLAGAAYYGVRQVRYWSTQELSPFQRRLEEVVRTLPPDARAVAVSGDRIWDHGELYHLVARLHPRPLYVLPPRYDSVEAARDWVREKRITWVITLGSGREGIDVGRINDRR